MPESSADVRVTVLWRSGSALFVGLAITAFMVLFEVPWPWSLVCGLFVFPGLYGLHWQASSFGDVVAGYALFAGVTWGFQVSFCNCTGVHFVVAPVVGIVVMAVAKIGWEAAVWACQAAGSVLHNR